MAEHRSPKPTTGVRSLAPLPALRRCFRWPDRKLPGHCFVEPWGFSINEGYFPNVHLSWGWHPRGRHGWVFFDAAISREWWVSWMFPHPIRRRYTTTRDWLLGYGQVLGV